MHNLGNIDATPQITQPATLPTSIPLLGLQLPTFTPTDFTQPAPRGPVEFSLCHLFREAFLDPRGVLAIYSGNIPFPFLSTDFARNVCRSLTDLAPPVSGQYDGLTGLL